MSEPRLITTSAPTDAEGVVLVLHGGGARLDRTAVSPAQLSVLRMIPVAARVRRAGRGRLAVFRLLNSARGWDTDHTPVDDVAWAMREVRRRYPGLPVALVGHSLGGRAALLAGGQPDVRAVVALNPYVLPSDLDADRTGLRGRRVLVVHGTDDRIAAPGRSADLARALMRTTDLGYVAVEGGRHAMLRRGGLYERAAAEFVAAVLVGREPAGAGPVADVLAGREWVAV